MSRLVIITNGNFFAQLILRKLLKYRHADITGIVITTGQLGKKSGIITLAHLLKKCGWRYFFYKAGTYLTFFLGGIIYRHRCFFVDQLAEKYGITVVKVQDVNSKSTEQLISNWSPEITISVSCNQRLGENILSLARKASINIHSSLLPAYAGLAPYFWVLVNGESQTGTTVHFMEKDFDTGNIIRQKKTCIYPDDSVFSLFYRLCLIGEEALFDAVNDVERGFKGTAQDPTLRSYYSWPTPESSNILKRNGYKMAKISDFIKVLHDPDEYEKLLLAKTAS